MDLKEEPVTPDPTDREDVDVPFPIISQDTKSKLEAFPDIAIRDFRPLKEDFIYWLLTKGKHTRKLEGYSETTARTTHYKIEETFRWLWDQKGGYTRNLTPEDASKLIQALVTRSTHPDPYVYTYEKCIQRFFKFLDDEYGIDYTYWNHDIELRQNYSESTKDKFRPKEMEALYAAAVQRYVLWFYGGEEEEMDEQKAYLAQRIEKPKDEITSQDIEAALSWKIPSIIAVCCDTGLRPIEVGRAKVDWINLTSEQMLIPADESTKNHEEWINALSKTSVRSLRRWLNERSRREMYDDEDRLWMTREGEPYGTYTLNPILNHLLERVEFNETGRNLTWYSFRHGAASMWAEKSGIYTAKEQLRHSSIKTTERYTRNTGEKAQAEADRMW